jgi:cytochrome c
MRILPLLLAALPLVAVAAATPGAPPPAFVRCAGCHAVGRDEPADMGPNLWGVSGARAGSRPGYDYSPALTKSGVVWTRDTLTRWLVDDQQVAPGTTMPKQTMPAADRDAIVAYLLTLKAPTPAP